MKKKILFSLVLITTCNLTVFGQRIDVELQRADSHRAVAMGKYGLLHHHIMGNELKFTRYDTAMKVVWQASTEIVGQHRYRGQEIDAGKVYILLSKFNDPIFTLITIDLQTGVLANVRFPLFKKLQVVQFRVLNERIFMGCYVDGIPTSHLVDLTQNFRSQNLISNLSLKARFSSIEKDTTFDIVNISVLEEKAGVNYLITKTYTILGQELLNFKIDITQQEKYPLTGSINYTYNYEAIVTGTYASKPDGFAEGIYVAKFSGEKKEYIKFYSFGSMPNFNEYESEFKRARSSHKKLRAIQQGKEFKLQYMMLTHKPVIIANSLFFIAEVYNPVFQTENSEVIVGNVLHPAQGAELDQYEFTHFMAVAIDIRTGDFVWDHTFSLYKTNINVLNYMVNSKAADKGIFLVYFTQNGLHTHFVSLEGELEERNTILPKNGKIIKNHFTNIQNWYAENLMIWGYQTVENRSKKPKKSFYFAKMQLND